MNKTKNNQLKIKLMKTFNPLLLLGRIVFLALLFLFHAGTASAASVTWSAPKYLTADSDISTAGTLVSAYFWLGIGDSGNVTVNGVTFTGTTSVSTVGPNLTLADPGDYGLSAGLPPGACCRGITSLSTNYLRLVNCAAFLDYATYFTVQLNNLVVGHIYQVQLWSCDSYYDTASTEVSDPDGNSVTLVKSESGNYGGVGQFTIGTFTADAPSLVLTLTGVGPFSPDKGPMLNALQLRDVTSGSSITWSSAMNIAGDTDVSTSGTQLYAYDALTASGVLALNGVTFMNATNGIPTPGADPDITAAPAMASVSGLGYSGCAQNSLPVCSLSANYQLFQDSAFSAPGTNSETVTLHHLTSGHTYLIQAWAAVSGSAGTRDVTYSSFGGNTVTLHVSVNGQIGTPGQYAIGTFTAIGTNQSFILAPTVLTYGAVMNAIQVRDTGAGESSSPPSPPTGLLLTPGYAQIALKWNASFQATSYNIKRATVSGGPYITVATGVTATSYTDTGLTNGTTYYYVVSATDAAGEGINSTEASATPSAALPAAPTGLTATAGNGQVILTWNSSAAATSYNVKRATVSGGPYTTFAASITTTNDTDTGLTNGMTYYYVVSGVNPGGEGADSSQVSATPTPVLAPITGSALNCLIAGRTNAALASGGATDTADTFITGYPPGQAINGIIDNTPYPWNGASDTTPNPWIPTDVNISGISPDWLVVDFHQSVYLGAIVISGRYPERGAGTYTFQYTTDPPPVTHASRWTTIGTYTWASANPLPRTGFQFGLLANVTGVQLVSAPNYTYNNGYGGGGWGNSIQQLEAYQPIAVPPPAPTGLSATPGNAQVSLSWTASSGATSYNVKQATVSGGPYTTIASGVATTNYNNTGLSNGTTYYYVVSAANSSGEGANSSEVSATPAIPPPNQLTGLSLSNGVFSFMLSGVVGSNYVIEVSSNLVDWTPLSTNTIPPAGSLQIIDPIQSQQERFYWVVPLAGISMTGP